MPGPPLVHRRGQSLRPTRMSFALSALLLAFVLGVLVPGASDRLAAQRNPISAEVPRLSGAQLRGIDAAHEFARCLARRNPEAARTYILADDDAAIDAAYRTMLPYRESVCVSAYRIRLLTVMLRGMIAESMYERDFDSTADPGASESGSPASGVGVQVQWSHNTPADQGFAGEVIAECYVPRNVAAVRGLLRTDPGSDQEVVALRGIASGLGGCVPDGPIVLSPMLLRSSLATALYRFTARRRTGSLLIELPAATRRASHA